MKIVNKQNVKINNTKSNCILTRPTTFIKNTITKSGRSYDKRNDNIKYLSHK